MSPAPVFVRTSGKKEKLLHVTACRSEENEGRSKFLPCEGKRSMIVNSFCFFRISNRNAKKMFGMFCLFKFIKNKKKVVFVRGQTAL